MTARTLTASLACAALALAAAGCSPAATTSTPPPEQTQPAQPAPTAEPAKGPTTEPVTELKIEDLTVGTGAEAKSGNAVTVNYTGWLADGTQFDTSVGGQPFGFTIGAGRVIQGWEQGVAGMKVGGKRRLIIPPALGYGDTGTPGGPIPGGATLIFDVELLTVQ